MLKNLLCRGNNLPCNGFSTICIIIQTIYKEKERQMKKIGPLFALSVSTAILPFALSFAGGTICGFMDGKNFKEILAHYYKNSKLTES